MAHLTGGAGSECADYAVEDWVRSIRHGLGPEGKPLVTMPSQQHWVMSDDDLGALLAYIQSLPPVDSELPFESPRLQRREARAKLLGLTSLAYAFLLTRLLVRAGELQAVRQRIHSRTISSRRALL
jgi:hypothetical protein